MKNNRVRARVVAFGALLFSATAWAALAAGAAGHWKGAIQTPGQELQVEVDLAVREPGAWVGTITIPAQNVRAFPLSSIEAKGEVVSFTMKGIPGDPLFKGRLSEDGGTLAGDFTQGGARLPFQLKRAGEAVITEAKSTSITKDLEGAWEGSLNAGGTVLRLRLKLSNRAEGGATGSLVSVDQGGAEIPISTITQAASTLKLELPSIGASYSGELRDGRLLGDWTQGSSTLPLAFTRSMP